MANRRHLQTVAVLGWVGAGLLVLLGSPEFAAAQSLDETVRGVVSEESKFRGPGLFAEVGMSPEAYRVAERTPRTGSYLVEVPVASKNWRVPVAFKVGRRGGRWSVDWSVSRDYARRVAEVLKRGDLVSLQGPGTRPWADRGGMPAFPVVFDASSAATPFGTFRLPKGDDLEPPPALGEHVGDWVRRQLEDDPGAAAVDLVPAPGAKWRQLTRIVFGLAGAGLFRIHFVVDAGVARGPSAWTVSAPVGTAERPMARDRALVVGVYDRSNSGREVRVSVRGERLSADGEAACGDRATLCVGSADDFEEKLGNLVERAFADRAPSVSHVMYAAVGSVPVEEALQYAQRVPGVFGIPSRKLMIGHIGEEGGRAGGGGR